MLGDEITHAHYIIVEPENVCDGNKINRESCEHAGMFMVFIKRGGRTSVHSAIDDFPDFSDPIVFIFCFRHVGSTIN